MSRICPQSTTPFLRFRSHTAGPSSPPVSQLPEVGSKKNWLDYFLLLTSCQCGFVFTAATCKPKLQSGGRCEGEVPSKRFWSKALSQPNLAHWISETAGILVPRSLLPLPLMVTLVLHRYLDFHICEVVQPVTVQNCFHGPNDSTMF